MKYYLVFLIVFFSCSKSKIQKFELPIYTPNDLDPNWIDHSLHNSKLPHFIPDFSFINQSGDTINSKSVEGKIIAVNYFFTTCPSICPMLTKNMKRVQDAFFNDDDLTILSHSVFPEHDTPAVLDAYADLYSIKSNNWHLLTGDKKKIYEMARKGHFAVKGNLNDELEDFIHTENFVLIDKKSRIRGFYNGTNPHGAVRMIEDINQLKQEI